ncbi:hypothetical protein [Streptomyces recifensis]|uniref:hypothetical protein n=1 Tax=Streptomyces recifensis TaxID=67355 RepID=UPI0011223501|nr:hypothetical protein [Streptomyces recifensis]
MHHKPATRIDPDRKHSLCLDAVAARLLQQPGVEVVRHDHAPCAAAGSRSRCWGGLALKPLSAGHAHAATRQ